MDFIQISSQFNQKNNFCFWFDKLFKDCLSDILYWHLLFTTIYHAPKIQIISLKR